MSTLLLLAGYVRFFFSIFAAKAVECQSSRGSLFTGRRGERKTHTTVGGERYTEGGKVRGESKEEDYCVICEHSYGTKNSRRPS